MTSRVFHSGSELESNFTNTISRFAPVFGSLSDTAKTVPTGFPPWYNRVPIKMRPADDTRPPLLGGATDAGADEFSALPTAKIERTKSAIMLNMVFNKSGFMMEDSREEKRNGTRKRTQK